MKPSEERHVPRLLQGNVPVKELVTDALLGSEMFGEMFDAMFVAETALAELRLIEPLVLWSRLLEAQQKLV